MSWRPGKTQAILFPPHNGIVTNEDCGNENEATIIFFIFLVACFSNKTTNEPFIFGENILHNLKEDGGEIDDSPPKKKKLVACKVGIRAKVLRDNDFEW
ncbi:hypothetical protein EVAR_58867_1 [Eumeta japonica]|uniref:Uncharacterized protein n=1 Tax=Eumeta variegata TaxID=151549 RepID=A0A4C1Y8F7_EUMVA|nr:hypothetical protein EVAR_58867_1 [Eumeta japonica]